MLEEIGEPYGLHLLNLKNGDNRKPDYFGGESSIAWEFRVEQWDAADCS
jgi:hypothetical protein